MKIKHNLNPHNSLRLIIFLCYISFFSLILLSYHSVRTEVTNPINAEPPSTQQTPASSPQKISQEAPPPAPISSEDREENTESSVETLIFTFPKEIEQTLNDELLFTQAKTVFAYGTYSEQATILKRLLTHYSRYTKEIESAEGKNEHQANPQELPPTQDKFPSPVSNTPRAEEEMQNTSNQETQDRPPVEETLSAISTDQDAKTSPPPKPIFSIPAAPALYQAYYQTFLADFFKKTQVPAELTDILLVWIRQVPLYAKWDFVENILGQSFPKTSQRNATGFFKTRQLALHTLSVIRPPESQNESVVKHLTSTLTDVAYNQKNVELMNTAAELLAKRGAMAKAVLIKAFTNTSNDDLKITIIQSIGSYQEDDDISFLKGIIESHEDKPVTWTALTELIKYPTSTEAEEILLRYSKNDDPQLSARAFYALSPFTSDRVHSALMEGTRHIHALVRLEALKALALLPRYHEEITPLVPLIEYKETYDPSPAVKQAAKTILIKYDLYKK